MALRWGWGGGGGGGRTTVAPKIPRVVAGPIPIHSDTAARGDRLDLQS